MGDSKSTNKFLGYMLVLLGGASAVLPLVAGSRGWILVGSLAGGLVFMAMEFLGARRR